MLVCLYRQDAKIMSWWDYGYQITAMANRTILVDNNTWNNTHISRWVSGGSAEVAQIKLINQSSEVLTPIIIIFI